MITTYQPLPPKPRRVARLKQLSKSNRLMRRYYAGLRRRELPGGK